MKIIDENLLASFRTAGPCQWCGKRCKVREPHHLIPRGMGGGSRLDLSINLVALGSTRHWECTCHRDAEDGKIQRCDLLAVVAAREGCLQSDILDVLRLILRLPKGQHSEHLEAELAAMNLSGRKLAERMLVGR